MTCAHVAAVTICSRNYLAKAITLAESYINHNEEHCFHIVIVDRRAEVDGFPDWINIIWVEDLGVPDFERKAFEFDVIEFNTNVKPIALISLLHVYEKVIYIDPDIYFFRGLESVVECLDYASVIVTPHAVTPINDKNKPDDVDFLRFGTFNLGFIAVSKKAEAFSFLEWWSARCLEYGFYEPQSGLAVDQKWVNLAPALCRSLKVMHDPGLNVAFWNLHERAISIDNGCWLINDVTPLSFVHFSSFDVDVPGLVAKKQSRYPVGSRPDFELAAAVYRNALAENLKVFSGSIPYGFDYFSDGAYISPALRRAYSAVKDVRFVLDNPFDSSGPVYDFAVRNNFFEKSARPHVRRTFQDAEGFRWQRKMVLSCLRLTLAIIGPSRYFSLMRYMAYVSSIRNQGDAFK